MIRPYTLAPDDRADESLRTILGALFESLQSNVEGAIAGADSEFLHDLRVANRRTRTALSQIKGVLRSEAVDQFAPEFKWLGNETGPCRDLDVALVELGRCREHVDSRDSDSLTNLRDYLQARRAGELERVSTALRSSRFNRLVDRWNDFLQTPTLADAEPPKAASRVVEVVGPRILKANRRLRKRGDGVADDSPASLLHRLRIDGKKLRYLLEFFSDLYDTSAVTRFIKELKRFQDILGDFNDTEVQLALIHDFVAQDSIASTDRAVEALREIILDRQRELRAEFAERFAGFASDESRKLYKRTFRL